MSNKYEALAKRFISDKNLPFQYIDYYHFRYCLVLFHKELEWNELIDVINSKFDGEPVKFLDEYYLIRDNIIQAILNSKEYSNFLEMDLNIFSLDKDSQTINSKNIYNRTNIGKKFISFDMKKANFQVLKHISSALVHNKNSYEDFIGDFCDLDYVKTSKYTRQVIFGKTNPKRQITCEKFFINEIRKLIDQYVNSSLITIMSMSNDELVYELSNNEYISDKDIERIYEYIYSISGFDMRITQFELHGYELQNMETGVCKFTFYEKIFNKGDNKLISVPMPYYKMVYKLMYDIKLEDEDYLFDWEGTTSQMLEEFEIKEIHE